MEELFRYAIQIERKGNENNTHRQRASKLGTMTRGVESSFVNVQDDPATAKKLLAIGEKPYDQKLDVSTLAAYTLVANTILNLDETMSQN